ncbi:MAG: sulfate ABC transporter permease subunit CysT [Candidatus Aminicenantes bacterium]|jgi:sulfate transport system permease protein|nr:sulfate ABC transporter permease subunit CysT [Candidatus Aminicenantes bacterium]MDH5383673.1 sulfate ABC transporter permease subunit CysT [Candidatus Aminicenantes bacterium]MDH5743954.1 sulfate ABC transporter permease subunit CysT [Candidatus Aminicenantes bacterium]
MSRNPLAKISGTSSDLLLRSLSFFYIGILIVLPIIAISSEAFKGGLNNLWTNITSSQALYSLKLTFITALLMVILNVIMGTATAWVLVRYNFPLKNLMNALIDLPFAIPTIVTGIMLVALYGPKSFIGGFFNRQGIEIIFAKPGIILALLYVSFPFVVRAVQPVLHEMEKDMEEAAITLGAGPFAVFRRVVLPTLLPAILTGAALSFSRAIGEFGSIAIVSGNIPFKTQVASVYIYGEIESYNPQGALGLSVVLLFFSFLILILLNRLQTWNRRHEEF